MDLVTAPEIIFFWVARMIMAGLMYRKDVPFKNVYFTGIVRDKQGRKMSKSLGNSPEPIELIGRYGADAVRMGMLLCSPAGNDLLYDDSLVEQGRNFCNKVWNAMRLVKGWEVDPGLKQSESDKISVEWFDSVLSAALADINEQFSRYRLSEALKDVYKLVWDDFCAWYLEMIKPAYQQPADAETYQATLDFFEKLIRLMHPFMPFLTEEIYHVLHNSGDESIMLTSMPEPGSTNEALLKEFSFVKELVMSVRGVRSAQNILPKEQIQVFIRSEKNASASSHFDEVVIRLCNLKDLIYSQEKPADSISFIVGTTECFIPLIKKINIEEELSKAAEELDYQRGFLVSIMKKLDNASFVNNAPAKVVEAEKKKKADAEARIVVLEDQISTLKR